MWPSRRASSPALIVPSPHRKNSRARYSRPDARDGMRSGDLAPHPDPLSNLDEPFTTFPPGLLILAQCRQRGLVGVVSPGTEQLEEHGVFRSDPSGYWPQWPSAVLKPRPAPGQRQAPIILGGVEPVQQIGVPRRQHPRRLLRVGLADTIGVAAELPAAFAHAPPGPLAVVQTLGFVGQPVGLAGPEAPPRQAGRAYAPATPGRGRQNTIAAHRPGGGL